MSARNPRLVLAPEAQSDLQDLLIITEQRWGRAQRRAHRRLLDESFADLAGFPGLGRARPEYGTGIRSHQVGRHVIIYQVTDVQLGILRILHVRRDIDGEFGEPP